MEVGQENKVKKREADLLVIEQALKTSKSSIRKAVQEVEAFFMCENDKKASKIKLKVTNLKTTFIFYFYCLFLITHLYFSAPSSIFLNCFLRCLFL